MNRRRREADETENGRRRWMRKRRIKGEVERRRGEVGGTENGRRRGRREE